MKRKGFTLIELMIVIAIIAIIAAIAIPGLLRARISANEGSAIGSLRTLSTSQAQFQSQNPVDQDGDGTGEFALLGELTGTSAMRSNGSMADPSYVTSALAPTGTQTMRTAGQKSGYYFKVYLPTAIAIPYSDPTGTATALSTWADRQEVKWRGIAWPVSAKTSGNRAFAIDQAGEVYGAPNVDTDVNDQPWWDGRTSVPTWWCCVSTVSDGGTFASNVGKGPDFWNDQKGTPSN